MQVLRYTLFGLLLVALIAGIVFWSNMGSQVRLNAEVLRVRTLATSESSALLIAEVRITNPARVPFVVREVRVSLVDSSGGSLAGESVAQGDLDRVLGYFPAEGPRYNETLKVRAKIPGHSQSDCTVPVSFTISKADLDARRGLEIEIEDVDRVRVKVSGK
ncbi:MAG: hypothetical protein IH602_22435 [Bryobacteraceae bacterium]|nr:hypothetical protein [Bryobacteraceae bacterium]